MEVGHIDKIFRRSLWLTAIVIVGSLFFWDLDVFLGALAGGALSAGNLWMLRRIVTAGATADTRRQGALTVLFLLKFAAMIVLVYFAVVHAPIDMVAFLVGVSASFLAILTESLRWSRQSLSSAG